MRSILDPFSIPKFVGEKQVIAIIHQLTREFWFCEINYVGYYFLEKKWLSNYKNTITLALSDSTKIDLEELVSREYLLFHPA
jgi:hypothetical protein